MNKKLLFLIIVFAMLFAATAFAADEVMDVKLDKNVYSPGENMSVSGTLLSGSSGISDRNVTINFNGTTALALTDSSGNFQKILTTPIEGDYNLTITYGSLGIIKPIKVTTISSVELAIIPSVSESYEVITFTGNAASVGITGDGSLTGELRFANFTNNGTNYYVIVQKDESSTGYDTLFISIASDFATINYQYLGKDSHISLNNADYTIFYIDPNGAKAIVLRKVDPVFYGTGDEWAKLFVLALNSSGGIITNSTSLTIEQIGDDGDRENITNETTAPDVPISERINGITNYGFTEQDLFANINGGNHEIIVEGMGHISYFVKKFELKAGVETTNNLMVSTASKGQVIVLKASIVELDNGTSISDTYADINAKIIKPNGSEETIALVASANNIFSANYSLDNNLAGEYAIIFTGTYSGDMIEKDYKIKVKSNEIFMKAFNTEKGEGEGFAPNTEGIIIIGGRDLSTGDFLNLSDLTGNCNASMIYIKGIFDSGKNNKLTGFNVQNLSEMLNLTEAPDWIKTDMNNMFGEKACAINFTTPLQSGTYKLETEANISGETANAKDYLDVTTVFVYGMPVNCQSSGWSDSVAPGARVCIKVSAYDAATGKQIAAVNITDVKLVEVFSMNRGVITDSIKNESMTMLNGQKILSFISSNNSLGHHEVKFKIKANVSNTTTSGVGHGFYRTELWNAFAYPDCSQNQNNMFCNFGSSSNITLKIDAFLAGFGSGKAGLSAAVSSVKNFETGETISIDGTDSISCTTVADNSSSNLNVNSTQTGGFVKPATCTLTIPMPLGGWSSGGHEVAITVTDENDNSMTINSWFKIESFMFYVWNKNWEITKGQNASFDITIKEFGGNNLSANITIAKLYYMGSEDKWMSPKEINFTATTQTISNGQGLYVINQSLLAGLKPGFYDIMFTAVTLNNGRQTARAGFNIKSFVVVANQIGDNWEHAYEKNKNLTVNITSFETINWLTWPPTGTPHTIINATVKRINKNGMWDTPYRQSGREVIGDSASCNANSCILNVPLTNFDQSQYDMTIEVTDNLGNTAMTGYWFKTETFTITVPEIQDWRTIPSTNKLSDKMTIKLSTEKSCGTTTDSITEPANVTNCLVDGDKNLPTIYDQWNQTMNRRTIFLLDKTNSSSPKLYVNTENETWQNNAQIHYNFTLASTIPININGEFTDTNGYRWKLTAIDVGLGRITLQSLNGVIRSRTKQADNTGGDTQTEYSNLYIVNKSISVSETFLYAGNGDGEERFWDDQWANIDLDGDGRYNCDPDTHICEEYFMLLADRASNGTYDTLLLSPTRNFSQGIDSYRGFNNSMTGDLRFAPNASPIYLLNLLYSETNGIGRYRIVTTTNKAGWPGRHLGLFQVGSDNIKVPVMVASPSTKAGIANKTVVIRKLRTFGGMSFEEKELQNIAVSNTSDNGIAILGINLSNISSGEYMIIIEVNETEGYITSGNDWDNPKIELRGFALSNLFGIKTSINTMEEWSESAGNLFKMNSTEAFIGKDGGATYLRMNCGQWNNDFSNPNICHVEDWRYKELWINLSDMSNITIFKDLTPNDWHLGAGDINESTIAAINDLIIVKSEFGGEIKYLFIDASINVEKQTISLGETITKQQPGSPCMFNIRLDSATPPQSINWTVNEVCPWGSNWTVEDNWMHDINQPEFLWGYFNISEVTADNATFNIFKKIVTLQSPVNVGQDLEEGNDGRIRIVTNAFESGYDLYIYNSNSTKTRDDIEGFSGMYDKIAVVNSSNQIVASYRFGQAIPQIGGKTVVRSNPWDQYVYISNFSINGELIYPLPWSCDEEKYYVGTFTEEDLGFKIYDGCGGMQGEQTLSATPQYIMLFDSMCDGAWQITSAKMDDDHILDDSWARKNQSCQGQDCYKAYDYDMPEQGEPSQCCGCGQEGQNQSEQWMEIGRESHPLSITNYQNVASGTLDLFKVKWGVNYGENITGLTLWVQAKKFDGTLIDGNITLEKATGMDWSCGMMQEIDVNVTTSDGTLDNGVGYLNINLTDVASPQPTMKFKVQDNLTTTLFEYITKSFHYAPAEQQMNGGGEMCEGIVKYGTMPQPVSASGGGGGSGDEMIWAQQEMDKCTPQINNQSCETNKCAWLNTTGLPVPPPDMADLFASINMTEMMCLPCFVMDDDETKCLQFSTTCEWHAAPPEDFMTGWCDPKYVGP